MVCYLVRRSWHIRGNEDWVLRFGSGRMLARVGALARRVSSRTRARSRRAVVKPQSVTSLKRQRLNRETGKYNRGQSTNLDRTRIGGWEGCSAGPAV